ncbi:MAG: alpha/beta fold hydrolase, partial [Gammaproteobacteria bacterium]
MKTSKLFQLFYLSCILFCTNTLQAKTPSTFLLVHGALFTSSVWAPVQSYLQNNGYNVITVDTPGRLNDGVSSQQATLAAAVQKVCQVAQAQNNPVILIGHNQAGAIITQATANCPQQIKALVYIAAVVPFPGERPFDVLSDQDNHNFDVSAPLDNNTGLSIPDRKAPIQTLFMADAQPEEAQRAILNMVPEPIIFAYNVLDYNLETFQKFPKYYIKTSNDFIISPESQ